MGEMYVLICRNRGTVCHLDKCPKEGIWLGALETSLPLLLEVIGAQMCLAFRSSQRLMNAQDLASCPLQWSKCLINVTSDDMKTEVVFERTVCNE